MSKTVKDFMELANNNPCEGCPAPCCQMQVMPWVPPKALMSVDHLRFALNFPDTEFIISQAGEFSLVKWSKCSLFDEKQATCTVHSTPKQPLTCVHFNPHQCWYKRNFVTEKEAPDVLRLNMERYDVWVQKIEFEEDQSIKSFPDFAEMQEAFKDIAIEPVFKKDANLTKKAEPAKLASV